MRKLITLALALGLFMAVPVGVASAQDQLKLAVRVHEHSGGFDETGTAYAEGTYQVFLDGVAIETGTVSSVYYTVDGTFVEGYRTFVDDATGNYVVTEGRWHLVKTNGSQFIYDGNMEVVDNSAGIIDAHIGSHVNVKLFADNSWNLSSLDKWRVEF
jgi:hypothetical protein